MHNWTTIPRLHALSLIFSQCVLKASEDGRFLLPIMVATFVKKSTAIVGRSTHQRLAELKVYPKGLTVLDQIVVSILVIARGI